MSGTPPAIRCQAPGCGRPLNAGMVFCTEHWTMLPRVHRDGVYASKHKPQKHRDAMSAAVRWLGQHLSQTMSVP
jgi:hypothetical protein